MGSIDKLFGDSKPSIFWLAAMIISFIGLVSMSLINNAINVPALGNAALLFWMLWGGAILLSFFNIFRVENNFRQTSFWLWAVFTIYYCILIIGESFSFSLIGKLQFPIQSELQKLSVSSTLPIFWKDFIISIVSPIVENAFFLFAIPFPIIWGLKKFTRKGSLLNNSFIQALIAAIPSALLFTIFHLGKETSFIFIAFIIMFSWVLAGWGELLSKDKFIPVVSILLSSTVAMHQANNILAQSSFLEFIVSMLFSQPFEQISYNLQLVVGWSFVIFWAIMGILALDYVRKGFK